MGDSILELDRVTVGYGRQAILRDVRLSLQRGSFTGLLGGNGSGKSTLLKTILGILPPISGQPIIHPLDGRPPVFGYMPQREALDPIFLISSFEVALMGVYGRVRPGRFVPAAERDWVRQCLQETGAADLAHKLFSQLSGGQKQRVLIARALAAKPDILFLDEPTAGIDAAATQAILEVLQSIHQSRRLTILLVSHDLISVRQYAQQVVWIHEGKTVQGSVAELLSRERIEQFLSLDLHS